MNAVGLLDALLGRSKPVRPDLDQLFALPAAAVTLQAGADLVPTGVGSVCFASVEGGAFKQLQRDVRRLLDVDLSGPDADVSGQDVGVTGPDADVARPDADGTGSDAEVAGPDAEVAAPGSASGAAAPGAVLDPATGQERRRSGIPVEFTQDEYGYTWLVVRHPPEELGELVNDLHAVNTLLEENGFGPQLLCSLVSFQAASPGTAADTATSDRRLALVYLYKRGTFYPFAPRPDRPETRDSATELEIRGLLTDDLPIEPDLGRWFPVWGAPGL